MALSRQLGNQTFIANTFSLSTMCRKREVSRNGLLVLKLSFRHSKFRYSYLGLSISIRDSASVIRITQCCNVSVAVIYTNKSVIKDREEPKKINERSLNGQKEILVNFKNRANDL